MKKQEYTIGRLLTLVSGLMLLLWMAAATPALRASDGAGQRGDSSGATALITSQTQSSPSSPTVSTLPATSVTSTSAQLNANVNPNAETTSAWFEYGTTTGYGSMTTRVTGITNSENPSFTLSGLAPNTTWHYRVLASNSVATSYGSDTSFTTSNTVDYTTTLTASPTNAGTVSGGGTGVWGTAQTVKATLGSGWLFANWTANGSVISTNASYTFTLTGNVMLVANFTPVTCTIVLGASPSSGGTVSGGGTFASNSSQTVIALTNTGYIFNNWTKNGSVLSTNASYTFTLAGNVTLVANFSVIKYSLGVSASPSAGGSVSGGGTFVWDTSQTVNAATNFGYTFANWTENGSVVSASVRYSFILSSNTTLVANFTPINYTVALSASPTNGASVSGGGVFAFGTSQTVIASTNSGYAFVNWTDNGVIVSSSPSYTFTLTNDTALVANFAVGYTVALSASPTNGGTVSGEGTFALGSSQTVAATTNGGYLFANWMEDSNVVSTNAAYTFTLATNRTLVANFTPGDIITVSASPSAGGTVSGAGTFAPGSTQTVLATTNSGYLFANWTETTNVVSTNAGYTFTLTNNRTLVANFTAVNTISLTASPTNGGSVSGGGVFAAGSSQTVFATTNNGYVFANWTENGRVVSANASYTFMLTTNRTLVANFTAVSTILLAASPTNGGSVGGGGTFASGVSRTVIATTNTGYAFANWTENSLVASTNASYTFTLTTNRTLVANFVAVNTIVVAAWPDAGGTVGGGGVFAQGSSQTVFATTNNGYAFANWTSNAVPVSTNASYTFTLTTNLTLLANFISVNTISLAASPTNGGTVGGGGVLPSGSSQTVTAAPRIGYSFTNWTQNGRVVSTNPAYTFTLISNVTLVAHFTVNDGILQVIIAPAAAATNGAQWQVDGGTFYNSGATVSNLAPGNHTVRYSVVSGWTAPSNQIVALKNKSLVKTTGTYTFDAKGIYNGLFAQPVINVGSSGMLSALAVTTSGSYSGKLLIGNTTNSISGSFSVSGQASNHIARSAARGGPLALQMTLNWNQSPPNITGTVSGTNGGLWTAGLTAELASKATNSAAYTALLLPSGTQPGFGDLLITNHASAVTLSGALADGTSFSQQVPLSGLGDLPVYGHLYGGKGLLLGWLGLESGSPTGSLTWIKEASRSSALYTNGFTNTVAVQGSPWTNPPPHVAAIDLPSGQLDISGGGLASNLTFTVAISSNNTLVKLSGSTNSLTGTNNPKTGSLTITFGNGNGKATTKATGAILQDTTNAAGFFLGKTNAGSFLLQPFVLQPGQQNGEDLWTASAYSYAACSNPGPGGGEHNAELRVGGWGDLYYSLLHFDLTGMPASASSAVLFLYCYSYNGSPGPTPIYLDRVTQFWWDWQTSGTGCDHERLWWADKPSATEWQQDAFPAPTQGQWYGIDITSLYNSWQNGTYPNFGLQLRPANNNNHFDSFYSSQYTNDATLRPKLVIVPGN